MKLTFAKRLACLSLSFPLVSGCSTTSWVDRNAQVLDRMADTLNEYGTIGMSSPMLVIPDDRFKFDLNNTSEFYFKDAKKDLQGRLAALSQDVTSSGLSTSAQVDPTQMANYAELQKNYQDSRIHYPSQISKVDQANSAKKQAQQDALTAALDADLLAADQMTDKVAKAKAIADAKKKYADGLATEDRPKPPDYPTAPKDGSDVPAKAADAAGVQNASKSFAGDGKLAGMSGLLGTNPEVTVNDRSALVTAAGDKAVQALFNALGDPTGAIKYMGKKVLFGVAMVSVTPGWRTRDGFAAHLTIAPEIVYEPARETILALTDMHPNPKPVLARQEAPLSLSDATKQLRNELATGVATQMARDNYLSAVKSNDFKLSRAASPDEISRQVSDGVVTKNAVLVTAVSPMTDTQNLQSASSDRSRQERALRLALALRSIGFNVGASAFFEHVKQLEQDVLTRNQEVQMTAVSNAGSFGFEIGPSLWAIGDPTQKPAKPEYRLVRQSFPVLVLLGFDEKDLVPVVIGDDIHEPTIKFVQTYRWVPLDAARAPYSLKESAKIKLNQEAYYAYQGRRCHVNWLGKMDDCKEDRKDIKEQSRGVFEQVISRGKSLSNELFGKFESQSLPLEWIVGEPASLSNVFPPEVQVSGDISNQKIIFYGKALDKIDLTNSAIEVIGGSGKKYDIVGNAVLTKDNTQLEVGVHIPSAELGELRLAFQPKGESTERILAPVVKLTKLSATTLPKVTQIFPSAIELKRNAAGKIADGETKVVLVGDGLSGISTTLSDISILGNDATVSALTFEKSTLNLTVKFTSASSPIAVQLCIKEASGTCDPKKPKTILTPPISIEVATAGNGKAGADKSRTLSYKSTTPTGTELKEVTINDTGNEVIKQGAGIIKEAVSSKAAGKEVNLSVK